MGNHPPSEFEEYRGLLYSIAYRMLGSAADAEDMVQETFVRWQRSDAANIKSLRAYLTRILTHLCLDLLDSPARRREELAPLTLPEPVTTDVQDGARGPRLIADSLSMAFLVMLQSLSPVERAAFLLRELFDYDYVDIARIVGKEEANCRQIVKRARDHVAERRPRFAASPEDVSLLTDRFADASRDGDIQSLLEVLAPDVTLYVDGGPTRAAYGKLRALIKPLQGAEQVARFVIAAQSQVPSGIHYRKHEINGSPAFVTLADETVIAVLSFEIVDGRIRSLYLQSDPAKLATIGAQLAGSGRN